MNKKIILAGIFLSLFWPAQAQMKNLGEIMDNSNLLLQDILYNSDNSIFGYIFIYSVDKVKEKDWKCEYLILDKNLNEIARNTFIQHKYTSRTIIQFIQCRKKGDNVLVTIGYAYTKVFAAANNYFNYLLTTYRSISLKENVISDEFYYDDGQFKTVNVTDDNLYNMYKKVDNVFEIYPIDNEHYSGYLVQETYKEAKDEYQIKELRVIDINKNLVWAYKFNQSATRNSYSRITKIYWPDETILITFSNFEKGEFTGNSLVSIDLLTGKKLFEYVVEDKNSAYYHNFKTEKYGDKIYLTGTYSPNDERRYIWEDRIGWFKTELDKDGKQVMKKYHPWTDASKFIQIKENGKLEDGYRLNSKEFLIFKDGSVSYLAEKFNEKKGASAFAGYDKSKSSDMVLVNFDDNFEIKSLNVIEKEVSTTFHYDYLFSQYIKNHTGAVFFFEDYKKSDTDKKNIWYLGINKIIDGNYSYEEIPMTSPKKEYVIVPYIAKEGYIMLREYNEKDKFNQIRLERLNY